MIDNLKDLALLKIREAYDLLKQAGISESIQDLLYKEEYYLDFINGNDEEYVEFFSCAVCRSNHNMTLSIKKDKSIQYCLSIDIEHRYYDLSFIDKVKFLYRFICNLFIDKQITNDFLLDANDLTRFKDVLKKIP